MERDKHCGGLVLQGVSIVEPPNCVICKLTLLPGEQKEASQTALLTDEGTKIELWVCSRCKGRLDDEARKA